MRELLASSVVGRLAVTVDQHPEIFPVNFVLERRSIVFRTAAETKLWESMKQEPAAFEIDGYESTSEEAWSVVARGTTSLIEDPADSPPQTRWASNRGNPEQKPTTFASHRKP